LSSLSIQHRSFTASLSPRTYWCIESCNSDFSQINFWRSRRPLFT